MLSRRALMVGAAAAPALLNPAKSRANDYPNRPIRVILPYAVGGGTDVLARQYSPRLTELLGQPLVIENRGGGATLLGIRLAAQSPADGYSLLFTTSVVAINPILYRDASYKYEDFVPVAPLARYNYMLVVHNSVPVNTLAEFVAYAKANPDKLNYVSLGKGSPTQLLTQRFMQAAGFEATEINYSGTGPAMKDAISGVVQFQLTAAADPYFKMQNTKILAVAYEDRIPIIPDVPTFKEIGYPSMVGGTWFALYAPAKTPQPMVQKLRQAVEQASKDLEQKLAATGTYLVPGGAEGFSAFVAKDVELWKKDIARLGLQLGAP